MHDGLILSGRYQLVESLGSGGMGSVWRANDLRLGGEVAVKLIDPQLATSPEALARFRREAQAAAAIRSTYVVQIFDYGVDGNTPYIAMELLRGESLTARLKQLGRLPPNQVGHILGHVGRALELAHAKGIVHRDLKPDNIYLVREGDEDIGKMLDFGIARSVGGFSSTAELKTKTGAILGTPFYMSAEQVSGQAVDHLTDIWSFGVIACECLLGHRVFNGESLGALFQEICVAPLPIPSACGPVPAGFDAWFARTVSRDRSARYQSIREAADALRSLCGTLTEKPPAILPTTPATFETVRPTSLPVSAVATPQAAFDLEQTAPPSANTIRRLVRRRPGLALGLTASSVLVLSSLIFYGQSVWTGARSAPSAQLERSAYAILPAPTVGDASVATQSSVVPSPEVVPVTPTPSATTGLVKHKLEVPRLTPPPKASASSPIGAGHIGQPPPPTTRPRRNVAGI